jgi:hypothetical protein
MILDKEYGPHLRMQYIKVLLDASFDKLRIYSKDKILLFEPVSSEIERPVENIHNGLVISSSYAY